MTLSPKAMILLKHIVTSLNESKDKKNFFLTYKGIHDSLGWDNIADKWGTSLTNHGLGEIFTWVYENNLPAITSLIISKEEMNPGAGFFVAYKRKKDDLAWWLVEATKAKEYNWLQHLEPEVIIEPNSSLGENDLAGARAFLMVWSPDSWKWEDFEEQYSKFKNEGTLTYQWGCGMNKSIRAGDRIYFIRLGRNDTRGIIGSGYAATDTFQDNHWNGEPDKIGNFIKITFEVLLNPSTESNRMISIEQLDETATLFKQNWHPQQSGISIREEALAFLDKNWFQVKTENLAREYREGRVRTTTVKSYERDPEARAKAIELHKCRCAICKFDFEKTYGELGKNFIHVHHIVPIHLRKGEEHKVDPEKDLIPVCPNCHAMIHHKGEHRTIEEIKSLLRKVA